MAAGNVTWPARSAGKREGERARTEDIGGGGGVDRGWRELARIRRGIHPRLTVLAMDAMDSGGTGRMSHVGRRAPRRRPLWVGRWAIDAWVFLPAACRLVKAVACHFLCRRRRHALLGRQVTNGSARRPRPHRNYRHINSQGTQPDQAPGLQISGRRAGIWNRGWVIGCVVGPFRTPGP